MHRCIHQDGKKEKEIHKSTPSRRGEKESPNPRRIHQRKEKRKNRRKEISNPCHIHQRKQDTAASSLFTQRQDPAKGQSSFMRTIRSSEAAETTGFEVASHDDGSGTLAGGGRSFARRQRLQAATALCRV
ncbi:Os05g0417251 [Oryza sativa Japonica Group]|uniref:Os05g0417251 protein n=1 Tax=Oryza sativa subsp. japonica TaxID=39947 RepID=A0A0P0WMC1_ORYSJ|nr:Os05g0417251 [Oryza sativa Japonica Group]